MKQVLICWLLMLCLSLPGQSQSIPEGAIGIDLHTSTADSTLYNAVQGFLETQEYVIEESDAAVYTLATESKEEPKHIRIRVLVAVENGVAHFTAEGSTVPGDTATNELFEYEGDTKVGFVVLNHLVDQFAKSFDLATIEYLLP